MSRKYLGVSVLEAARNRMEFAFKTFPKICVSFSGGKDSTVMLHLAMEQAKRSGRRCSVLFVDLEGQYKMTIDFIQQMYDLYADRIDPYWIALPLNLRNAVSMFEPQWMCWDQAAKDRWVRQPPAIAITDPKRFPWFRERMEFEELIPEFQWWLSDKQLTGCLVGIRTQESLNRWRSLTRKKATFEGRQWTTYTGKATYNVYPIYDWQTEDIWRYHALTGLPHNPVYDLMHKAGLSIHQQRICQPYGDDQRKGLWLFHLIEPETWGRVVARVSGANAGALYANETGNVLGIRKVTKPDSITWRQFAERLLESMPKQTADHYRDKITVFLHWYANRGFPDGIPDEGPSVSKEIPSWTRIVKALLRNDYWCKGLSFTQHKSPAFEKYQKLMKKRREQKEWQHL